MVVIQGQAPTPGWFGSRWQAEMNLYKENGKEA